ncbi:MAG: hypothetical protein ACXWR0_05155 [Bdellovibrio sp.]
MANLRWSEILKKVEKLIPDYTEEKLAVELGVSRPTVNKWKNDKSLVPEWTSVKSLAEFIVSEAKQGRFPMENLEDISLLAWAKQTQEKGFLISLPAPHLAIDIFGDINKSNGQLLTAGFAGAAGLGIGATGFLVSSAFGPVGMVIGGAIGVIGGYLFADYKKKELTKFKDELEGVGKLIFDGQRKLVEDFIQASLKIEKQHQDHIKDSKKKIHLIIEKNLDAASRLGGDFERKLISKIENLPSPCSYFGISSDILESMNFELTKSINKG